MSYIRAKKIMFSSAVRLSYSSGKWLTIPNWRRTKSASLGRSHPPICTLPLVGRDSAPRIRRNVLLPEPFGPSSVTNSPRDTAKSRPRSTGFTPKTFVSPRTEIIASAASRSGIRVLVQQRNQPVHQDRPALLVGVLVDPTRLVAISERREHLQQFVLRGASRGRAPVIHHARTRRTGGHQSGRGAPLPPPHHRRHADNRDAQ